MDTKTNIYRLLKDYCYQSSLHGPRYLAQDKSHWIKKTFWVLIIVMSLSFWMIMSQVLLNKFTMTPTVTVVETTDYPTTNIAFPAVTVCNQNLVYQPNTVNITDILTKRGYNDSMIERFYDSVSLEKIYFNRKRASEISSMYEVLEKIGYTTKRILKTLGQPCEQLLSKCWWRSQEVPCALAFRTILVSQGCCCRFDLEYLRKNFKSGSPITAAGFDKFRGLSVEVAAGIVRKNYTTSWLPAAAKAIVGNPNRGLSINDDPILVEASVEINIAIEPSVMESSEEVRALSLAARQCLLEHGTERDTRYESTESKSFGGCVAFGYHRELVDRCHCTLFYLNESDPTELWSQYPECRISDSQCLQELGSDGLTRMLSNISERYRCFTACDEVDYEYTIDYVHRDRDIADVGGGRSLVNVFLRERTCLKYRREVLFSWDQLLASLGGTFGLCLGGSIVSFVELVCLALDVCVAALGPRAATQSIVPSAFKKNRKRTRKTRKHVVYPITEFIGGRF